MMRASAAGPAATATYGVIYTTFDGCAFTFNGDAVQETTMGKKRKSKAQGKAAAKAKQEKKQPKKRGK